MDAASWIIRHRYGADVSSPLLSSQDPTLSAASEFARDATSKLRWSDGRVLPPRPLTSPGPGGEEVPTGGQVVLISGPFGSIDPQKLLLAAQAAAVPLGVATSLGSEFSTPVNGKMWTFQPVMFL